MRKTTKRREVATTERVDELAQVQPDEPAIERADEPAIERVEVKAPARREVGTITRRDVKAITRSKMVRMGIRIPESLAERIRIQAAKEQVDYGEVVASWGMAVPPRVWVTTRREHVPATAAESGRSEAGEG